MIGAIRLQGAYPVLCTPFTDSGCIAMEDFDALIEFVVTAEADGCVFPGVASEVDMLSDTERAELVARLGMRLEGRLPFIVGASAGTAAAVAARVAEGQAAGAVAAMIMAPAAFGHEVALHIEFYRAIDLQANLPLMLQNAPAPIGAGLPPELVAEIARAVPSIRWVKEETLPCGQHLTRIVAAAGDAIDGVFGGAGGRYITDELGRGSLGTMPAVEFTDVHARLVRAWRLGNHDEARRLFECTLPALNLQAVFRMHMTKYTLAWRGVIQHTHVRGKGPHMDAGDRSELLSWLQRLAPELADVT